MTTQIKAKAQSFLQSQNLEVRRAPSGRRLLARTPLEVEHLVARHFFPKQRNGIMVEIGAASPDFLSQGAFFRARGWRVLSVEPNPHFCERHRQIGNEIYQYACSSRDEDHVEFSIVHAREPGIISNESFSSFSIKPGYAALQPDLDVQKIRVAARRLDTILEVNAPEVNSIDYLAIDVEGWELEVLDGFSMEKYRPRVVVIENLLRDNGYRAYMRKRGYRLCKGLHPNEIYVRR